MTAFGTGIGWLSALARRIAMRVSISAAECRQSSPLASAAQSLFERDHCLRRAVTRHDDLLAVHMQCVEGVKEFFLRGFFAGDELDVVNQQHVCRAILGTKVFSRLCADALMRSLVNCSDEV